jgi:hypothetical protein
MDHLLLTSGAGPSMLTTKHVRGSATNLLEYILFLSLSQQILCVMNTINLSIPSGGQEFTVKDMLEKDYQNRGLDLGELNAADDDG